MNNNWKCGRFEIDLSDAKIMGVLNCTPDSFSDGGKFVNVKAALLHAERMLDDGADILDIGGESTRPGAKSVTPDEEIKRLMPIVSELLKLGIPISVDTKNTKTMQVMLDLGVDIINDVNGFEAEGAIESVAQSDCGIVVMHMRGDPETMQENIQYQNVFEEVNTYLEKRIQVIQENKIDKQRICVDPGFGFGKTPQQNMQLIKYNKRLLSGEYPILIGVSRKSTLGYYLKEKDPNNRKIASILLSALGVYEGANIVRVHDVAEMKEGVLILEALRNEQA